LIRKWAGPGSRHCAELLIRIPERRWLGRLACPGPTVTVSRHGEEGKGIDDRAFASATELPGEIRDRRIGCVELLDFYLARAERHNHALKAIVVWQSTTRENAPGPPMPPSHAESAARHSDDRQRIVQCRGPAQAGGASESARCYP
jgi:hypothetical protein